METEPEIPDLLPKLCKKGWCISPVSREDPYYSVGQGPDPLGRHADSWMSWGWTLRRWVEPTDSNCLLSGSRVQVGGGPQAHLRPALVGVGEVSRVC